MHELHTDRAFADRGGDALDAVGAHVAHGEYAGKAGFEQIGRARQQPAGSGEVFGAQFGSCAHEVLVVERHATRQPGGIRHGPGHHEHAADLAYLRPTGCRVMPRQALEAFIAIQCRDLRARVQRNARVFLDAPDQVARHAVGEAFGTHQHVHMAAAASEENGGLAGRIAATDDDDFLVLAQFRLEVGRGVIDSRADEFRQVGNARVAIFRARCNDDGTGLHHAAVRQFQRVRPAFAEQTRGMAGDVDVGAELLCLYQCAAGQRHAGDAGGKAEIVLDPGTRSGLSAGRIGLDHQYVETFRRRVDRGGEPGRAGADHDQVMHPGVVDGRIHLQEIGDLRDARILEDASAAADQDRHLVDRNLKAFEQGLHIAVGVDVDADVGITVARQEFTQAQGAGRVARTEQHRFALTGRHQSHAPQDERAHEHFADLRVGLHDVAQTRLADRQDLPGLAHADARETGDAAQRAHFPCEIARLQHGHDFFAAHAGEGDFQAAGQHDHHVVMALARFDQHFAGFRAYAPSVRLEAGELHGGELGKHLLAAFFIELVWHCVLLACAYFSSSSTSSMKHQLQSSPRSREVMIGWRVAWKCLVACLFLELSQQPTWPQVRHRRRCTQVSPMARHSSQPSPLGSLVFTRFRCVHWSDMAILFEFETPLRRRGLS